MVRRPFTRARARRLRQRHRPPAGLGRGRLRVRRAGRGGAGRDARRARGRSGRGRRAAVRGRSGPAAGRRATPPSAQVAEARARLARLEAAQQRTGGDRGAGSAGAARAGDARPLDLPSWSGSSRSSARGVAAQAQLDTARANFNRDKAALEEVRRQIAVARLSAREEDIAGARQTLAAARGAPQIPPRPSSRGASSYRRSAARCSRSTTGRARWCRRDGRCCRSCRPATSSCASSWRRRCCRRSRSATRVEVTCDGCAPLMRARELHRALGRIHAAGDLQPRRAQQARVHGRGAAGKAGRPARRAAGAGRAQGREAKK